MAESRAVNRKTTRVRNRRICPDCRMAYFSGNSVKIFYAFTFLISQVCCCYSIGSLSLYLTHTHTRTCTHAHNTHSSISLYNLYYNHEEKHWALWIHVMFLLWVDYSSFTCSLMLLPSPTVWSAPPLRQDPTPVLCGSHRLTVGPQVRPPVPQQEGLPLPLKQQSCLGQSCVTLQAFQQDGCRQQQPQVDEYSEVVQKHQNRDVCVLKHLGTTNRILLVLK